MTCRKRRDGVKTAGEWRCGSFGSVKALRSRHSALKRFGTVALNRFESRRRENERFSEFGLGQGSRRRASINRSKCCS